MQFYFDGFDMNIGIIDWFDAEKGFGVIKSSLNKEYFLHHSNMKDKNIKFQEGNYVHFESFYDSKKKRDVAFNCELFSQKHLPTLNFWTENKECKIDNSSIIFKAIKNLIKGNDDEIKLTNLLNEVANKEELNYNLITIIDNLYSEKIVSEINIQHGREIVFKKINSLHWINSIKDNKFELLKNFLSLPDDFEIDQETLITFMDDINSNHFSIISDFTYFTEFLDLFISKRLIENNWLTSSECAKLYNFTNNQRFLKQHKIIKTEMENEIEKDIFNLLGNYSSLDNIDIYQDLKSKIKLNFNHVKFVFDTKLNKYISDFIKNNSSIEIKLLAYVDGYIIDLSSQDIKQILIDQIKAKKYNKAKVRIFKQLSENDKIQIITKLLSLEILETIEFIGEYVNDLESLGSNFNFKTSIYDNNFWAKKISNKYIIEIQKYINIQLSEHNKFNLLLAGINVELSSESILKNISLINDKIFSQTIIYYNKSEIFDILKKRFEFLFRLIDGSEKVNFISTDYNKPEIYYIERDNTGILNNFFILCNQYLSPENISEFSCLAYNNLPLEYYSELWLEGLVENTPYDYIIEASSDYLNLNRIATILKSGKISLENIQKIIYSSLVENNIIYSRDDFYKKFNLIKIIINPNVFFQKNQNQVELRCNIEFCEKLKSLNNQFINLCMWALGENIQLDYQVLKKYIFYFNANDQLLIFKKLFYFKIQGFLNFDVSFIYDLFINVNDNQEILSKPTTGLDINPEILLCYSILNEFQLNQRVPGLEKIIRSILTHPLTPKNKQISLEKSTLFDYCNGRTYASKDKVSYGTITKKDTSSYSVRLPFKVYNGSSNIDNPYFEEHKIYLKHNLNARWNSIDQSWVINLKYEEQLMEFAVNAKFIVEIPNHYLESGEYLRQLEKTVTPTSITFCEGRPMPQLDPRLRIKYWWCAGKACYASCTNELPKSNWNDLKLLDFLKIFNFNLDEYNHVGDLVQNSQYLKLVGLINRAILMFNKLKCDECGHLLFPEDMSHYASHNFVKFRCVNSECSCKETIYLNHCLQSTCKNVIDSRISKQCSNDLYICDVCGTCCSQTMFQKRLDKLTRNSQADTTHKYKTIESLKYKIFHQLGHYELLKYYCYKCAGPMPKVPVNGLLECSNCNISYNVKKILSFKEYQSRFNSN